MASTEGETAPPVPKMSLHQDFFLGRKTAYHLGLFSQAQPFAELVRREHFRLLSPPQGEHITNINSEKPTFYVHF
jgi:hypothetical protein